MTLLNVTCLYLINEAMWNKFKWQTQTTIDVRQIAQTGRDGDS